MAHVAAGAAQIDAVVCRIVGCSSEGVMMFPDVVQTDPEDAVPCRAAAGQC